MPWQECDVVDQRTEFVLRVIQGPERFGDVCRAYGISRKTGYKWKERFLSEGLPGLGDASRRPKTSPTELSESMVCQIVKLKHAHPGWGPRKLRAVLARTLPGTGELPSESSFKRVLDKAGLVERRRRRTTSQQSRLTTPVRPERPNQVWTIDFKGWWYTRNRSRFEPLTIRDGYSRYVLCAQALDNACTETVREAMVRVFERHGLPEVIRSDNGSPFAARQAPLGLSRLSAWWLTLGIDLDRIAPGRPDQNGGHERMHRDVAVEVESRAESDLASQQAALDVWRQTFNEERPHEALGMRVPRELYELSSRKYDASPVELAYPSDYIVRKVMRAGHVNVAKRSIPISAALGGWDVGLEPINAERYGVWFCRLRLGELDLSTEKFQAVCAESTRGRRPRQERSQPGREIFLPPGAPGGNTSLNPSTNLIAPPMS
jgi:transposase InsO family protein